jgi:hypothetical protein
MFLQVMFFVQPVMFLQVMFFCSAGHVFASHVFLFSRSCFCKSCFFVQPVMFLQVMFFVQPVMFLQVMFFVQPHSIPFQARLRPAMFLVDEDVGAFCGGSLISPNFVLTGFDFNAV